MKGYKGFDMNLQCLGFQYEIGKSYKIDGKLEMCKNGFHFCQKLTDVLKWKHGKIRVCEIEASGNIQTDGTKSVCPVIKIVRELSKDELNIGYENTGIWNSGNSNSGDWNSGNSNYGNSNSGGFNIGDHNSGHYNSGDFNYGDFNSGDSNSGSYNSGGRNSGNYNNDFSNSGDWNSGHCNSGDHNSGIYNSGDHNSGNFNSGNWNSGDHNSGYFNRDKPKMIRVFEKFVPECEWKFKNLPEFIHFQLNKWVTFKEMSKEEIKLRPNAEHLNGYLKTMSYKDAFRKSWENAVSGDRKLLFELPNFDPKIFEDISGIDVTTSEEWKEYCENKKSMNGIFCPYCGKFNQPIISGGTDGTLNGHWECFNCHKQWTFNEVKFNDTINIKKDDS